MGIMAGGGIASGIPPNASRHSFPRHGLLHRDQSADERIFRWRDFRQRRVALIGFPVGSFASRLSTATRSRALAQAGGPTCI